MNPSTREAAGLRRKPPDARAGCPESRLGLPLRDSPPSGLQAKKCSSSLGWVFLKSPSSGHQLVPCSVWPARCAQRRAARGHTVAADLSARAPGWSASGLAIQEAPRADGAVTRTALPDEPWPRTGDDWAAAGGREGLAAQRRVHPAGHTARGARSSARGAFNTMDRSRDRGSPPAGQPVPGRHADLPSALFFLSIHPTGSRPASPATPLPHFIWLPSSPGNVLPGAKKMLQAPRKTAAPALQNNPPPSPATRARHCSCLLYPTGVSRSQTAPFSSQPTQEPRRRLTRQRAENPVPVSASHDQAPGARCPPR